MGWNDGQCNAISNAAGVLNCTMLPIHTTKKAASLFFCCASLIAWSNVFTPCATLEIASNPHRTMKGTFFCSQMLATEQTRQKSEQLCLSWINFQRQKTRTNCQF